MNLAAILPLAFVMIAGPQIVSAIFLATTDHWARNSLAYLAGATISITLVITLAYALGKGVQGAESGGGKSSTKTIIDWIVLILVLVLMVRVYMTRDTREPPKWMGKLQEARPRFAFLLGLALLGFFPTDIITSVTVGLHLARRDLPWWECLPFVAVTLLLLGLPALGVVVLGKRAATVLPRIRDWMNAKSWLVSEAVLLFFAVLQVDSLLSD